jgi:hypothetical protein
MSLTPTRLIDRMSTSEPLPSCAGRTRTTILSLNLKKKLVSTASTMPFAGSVVTISQPRCSARSRARLTVSSTLQGTRMVAMSP